MALVSGLPLSDLQSALELLQTFDPPGIAALDLQDSLLKQMEIRNLDHTLPYQIVRDHFQLLVRRRVPELSRKLSQSTDVVHKCLQKISELDPAPGRRFSDDHNQSVAPDAIVEKVADDWVVHLNNDYIPRLRINKTYKELISKGTLSSKENMSVIKCVQESF